MEEKDLLLEKELKKFNWGAAYFGLIWSAVNRCFKKWFINSLVISLIVLAISFVIGAIVNFVNPAAGIMMSIAGSVILPLVLIIVIFVYVGIKGNHWAWESYQDKNIEKFQRTQRIWGRIAGVLLAFNLFGILINFAFIHFLMNSPDETASSSSETSYISARSCNTVSKVLPAAIKNVKEDEQWISNLAKVIEKNEEISYAYGFDYSKRISLTFSYSDVLLSDHVYLNVTREKPCSISEGNCYISAPTADKETACRFYFDDNGKVVPSKKTKLFINQ